MARPRKKGANPLNPEVSKEDKILEALANQTNVLVSLAHAVSKLGESFENSAKKVKKIAKEVDTEEVTTKTKTSKRGRKPKQTKKVANLFESMPEFKKHKDDVAKDKKLWAGREPSERGVRSTLVDIKCSGCNKMLKVNPNEVHEESSYKCNNCIVGKRG